MHYLQFSRTKPQIIKFWTCWAIILLFTCQSFGRFRSFLFLSCSDFLEMFWCVWPFQQTGITLLRFQLLPIVYLAEMVILSFNPTIQPSSHPATQTSMKESEQSKTQKMKVVCLYEQTIKMFLDHTPTPKMAQLWSKSLTLLCLCVHNL